MTSISLAEHAKHKCQPFCSYNSARVEDQYNRIELISYATMVAWVDKITRELKVRRSYWKFSKATNAHIVEFARQMGYSTYIEQYLVDC